MYKCLQLLGSHICRDLAKISLLSTFVFLSSFGTVSANAEIKTIPIVAECVVKGESPLRTEILLTAPAPFFQGYSKYQAYSNSGSIRVIPSEIPITVTFTGERKTQAKMNFEVEDLEYLLSKYQKVGLIYPNGLFSEAYLGETTETSYISVLDLEDLRAKLSSCETSTERLTKSLQEARDKRKEKTPTERLKKYFGFD